MNLASIIALSETSTAIYLKHKDTEEEWNYSRRYVSDHSILNSGWDFHWISSNVAGVVNQLEKGMVHDAGCLGLLGSFRFMSKDILETYFPQPKKCPLFIGHLFLKQQLLEVCLAIIEQESVT